MIFIIFAGIAAGVCISLYGWGLLLHRLISYPVRNRVVTITIGLGIVIFFGGVLNLIRCAFGWVFDGLLIAGVVLAVKYYRSSPAFPRNRNKGFHLIILGVIITMIMYFTVETQLPPKVFNRHDDFEKYFSYPVRMLQTGTLFGSPLSALGSETLGGQAVLHGIVLNHFRIPYINGTDAVFGLLLCLLLSVSEVSLRAVFLPIAVISILVVFFINPQYVNVSTLYIGSAFVMALILLLTDIQETKNENEENLPPPILIGLIYAALVALKSSFAVFVLFGLISYIVVLGMYGVNLRRLVRWSAGAAGFTFLFLLPWIFLYLPYYMHIGTIHTLAHGIGSYGEHLNFPSNEPHFGIANLERYAFLSIAATLPALAIVIWKRRERVPSRRIALAGLAACGIAVMASFLLLAALGPSLNGYDGCIRYSIPFLIASVPIILSLAYLWAVTDKSFGFKLTFTAMPILLGISILVIFSQFLMMRLRQGYERGSILAFTKKAIEPEYMQYSREVLYGNVGAGITAAQSHIPAGQAAVVWVSTPFYLDYKRNVIFDMEPGGIASPWAYLPDADYFMLQYHGPAVRTFATYVDDASYGRHELYRSRMCVAFLKYAQEIMKNSDELYNDGQIVVFKKHKE